MKTQTQEEKLTRVNNELKFQIQILREDNQRLIAQLSAKMAAGAKSIPKASLDKDLIILGSLGITIISTLLYTYL